MGELLGLSWGDLNFEQQTISILKSLWGKQVVRPKTDASIRTLFAGLMLMDVLRSQVALNSLQPIRSGVL